MALVRRACFCLGESVDLSILTIYQCDSPIDFPAVAFAQYLLGFAFHTVERHLPVTQTIFYRLSYDIFHL